MYRYKRMPKKLTQTEFITRAKATWGEHYDLGRVQYVKSTEKIEVGCRKHGVFRITANDFLDGHGCKKCANEAKSIKYRTTQQEFIEKVKKVHGDKYDLSMAVYGKSNKEKVKIICEQHGIFQIIAHDLLGGHGCPTCAGVAKLTPDVFLERAKKVHGNKYDLSKMVYNRRDEKIVVLCPVHGEFSIVPSNFINQAHGCPQCGVEKRVNKRRMTQEQFMQKAYDVHGNRYILDRVCYKSSHEKIEIICKQHGAWESMPYAFLDGHGCPKCAVSKRSNEKRLTQEEFILRAKSICGDNYSLHNVKYKSAKEKIEIICRHHGPWMVRPYDFCTGHGCPRCARTGPSKGENEVVDFIESLGFNPLRSDRTILQPKELDIYIPEKKLAVEFNGCYFHSDQMKSKKYHYEKYKQCKEQGIRLIQIMDMIWETRQEQVKSLICNALGMTEGRKIDARKCEIQEVKVAELRDFFDQYHIQGHVHTAKLSLVLVYDDEIVAAMTFGKGTNQRGKAREGKEAIWTLSRYATSCLVRGGFQRLLKHGREIIQDTIVSYSMNDYFSGDVYTKSGFQIAGEVAPDYQVYHQRCGLKPKSYWQRRNIPKRLEEIGLEDTFNPETDERTEWQIEDEVGAIRIWDSGKTRWILED